MNDKSFMIVSCQPSNNKSLTQGSHDVEAGNGFAQGGHTELFPRARDEIYSLITYLGQIWQGN